jgi:hypothetical protein
VWCMHPGADGIEREVKREGTTMMKTGQVEQLPEENAQRRERTSDQDSLCQGCEDWRRRMVMTWAVFWFSMHLIVLQKAKMQHHLSDEEVGMWLAQRTTPRHLLSLFGFGFAPLLVVVARWNWLLWKHDQPCAAQRVVAAYRWMAGHLRKFVCHRNGTE